MAEDAAWEENEGFLTNAVGRIAQRAPQTTKAIVVTPEARGGVAESVR